MARFRRVAGWFILGLVGLACLALASREPGSKANPASSPMEKAEKAQQVTNLRPRLPKTPASAAAAPDAPRADHPVPSSVREQVLSTIRIPRNLFISQDDKARQIAALPNGPAALVSFLTEVPDTLDDKKLFEAAAKERMSALDLLETLAGLDGEADARDVATAGLEGLVALPVSRHASFAVQRMTVAGKAEALAALTRVSPSRGIAAFLAFKSAEQRGFLEDAVVLGLSDLGLTTGQASRYLKELPSIND